MINTENNSHEFYMAKCVAFGKTAKARGDSPVGSLIVQNQKIIGEGIEGAKTNCDITFHAEIEAIRNAVKNTGLSNMSDCTLYSTHEPCIMCSYVIRHLKIGIVVVGISTGEIGGYSSNYPLLMDSSIKKWNTPPIVIKGILEKECMALHQ